MAPDPFSQGQAPRSSERQGRQQGSPGMARKHTPGPQSETNPEMTPADSGPRAATAPLSNGHPDSRALLTALKALKKGDFSARLPVDENGIGAAIAETFNEVAELLE